jgi:diadenosine tetraphosphate (Ap4A) HIT family hydrolase
MFTLHPNLASKTWIADLPLCTVFLEDNKHYPWLLLVPRRPDVARLIDLPTQDQLQWLQELDLVQRILWEEFRPTQLNVAAIGNKTPQLHTHVIARYATDPAWPGTVWDHPARCKYDEGEKKVIVEQLQKRFPVC